MTSFSLVIFIALSLLFLANGYLQSSSLAKYSKQTHRFNPIETDNAKYQSYGNSLQQQRAKPLKDLLGLGPAEIAITLVVALVLFGPETLKSLSKDVGKAAAELKEIPKTFKEGMDEGAASSQVSIHSMRTLTILPK